MVCPHCARWNFPPLEKRREAIEQEWRRAEAPARIADDRLLPGTVHDRLDRRRRPAGAHTIGRRRSTSA